MHMANAKILHNLYSIGSRLGFALGVMQILCFVFGVRQILAFLRYQHVGKEGVLLRNVSPSLVLCDHFLVVGYLNYRLGQVGYGHLLYVYFGSDWGTVLKIGLSH